MNKKCMFVILTLMIAASIVFSPAVVPTALSMVVHGANPGSAPGANFSGTPTTGPAPLQVGFSDDSTGDPTGWAWYFGDEAFDNSWAAMTKGAEWRARSEHTSVVLPNGSIVLMGGKSASSLENDVWRSTDQGLTWEQMTPAAGWSARRGHTSVALPDGNIVLMGGNGSFTSGLYQNRDDVWRSKDQGATWEQMTASAPWSKRSGHSSVALPDGSIVLMGGFTYSNDVWRSTDQGATWIKMTAIAPWSEREGHSSVALPDGSIVLMGGYGWTGGKFDLCNDVWRSTDLGATWKQLTAAAKWAGRTNHTSVVLHDDSIVLMGGWYRDDGTKYLNDVWRSTNQGATWTPMNIAAGWSKRTGHTSVALPEGIIFLMGGDNRDDVWRSTDLGATWKQLTAAADWSARSGHTSVTLGDGSIVLMGGSTKNDVWRSTDQGATWNLMTAAAPWTMRSNHTSVALPDGSIVLMGGITVGNRFNDVWRSTDQGATWTSMTLAAEWSGRYHHTSLVLLDGSIVLMGGFDDSRRNDVWRSTDQGKTWTQVTAAAPWTARTDHTSVVLPDGSIVLMGGMDGYQSLKNDVWRSTDQGATWTEMTTAAEWVARSGHTSVTLPDGSIVLMGGSDGTTRNDVWRSTDQGATWTQMTAAAEWAARIGHTSVTLPDGSIVLMGGFAGSRNYDVWRVETAGSNEQHPIHTYTELGTYSVALQVYNADGYSGIIKKAYINVTGTIPDPDGLKLFLPLIMH